MHFYYFGLALYCPSARRTNANKSFLKSIHLSTGAVVAINQINGNLYMENLLQHPHFDLFEATHLTHFFESIWEQMAKQTN